jgi:methyl-accepting chemotaxis protein
MQIVGGMILYFEFRISNGYSSITNNILNIYQLSDKSSSFVNKYFSLLQNRDTQVYQDEYNIAYNEINALLKNLDTSIIYEGSKVSYTGLKNVIVGIVDSCEQGLKASNLGDLATAYKLYDEATDQSYYIKDNAATLILKELEYTKGSHADLINLRDRTFLIGVVLIIVVTVVSLLLAFYYLNRLTRPIVSLAQLSYQISNSKQRVKIDQKLVSRKDEIGILSRSLQRMINNICLNIDELDETNKDLLKIKQELEKKNENLEKFNKVVVNIEIKMVELKKEMEKLRNQMTK